MACLFVWVDVSFLLYLLNIKFIYSLFSGVTGVWSGSGSGDHQSLMGVSRTRFSTWWHLLGHTYYSSSTSSSFRLQVGERQLGRNVSCWIFNPMSSLSLLPHHMPSHHFLLLLLLLPPSPQKQSHSPWYVHDHQAPAPISYCLVALVLLTHLTCVICGLCSLWRLWCFDHLWDWCRLWWVSLLPPSPPCSTTATYSPRTSSWKDWFSMNCWIRRTISSISSSTSWGVSGRYFLNSYPSLQDSIQILEPSDYDFSYLLSFLVS